MARCESLDLVRNKISESKLIKKEPETDSDSESDLAYMLNLDMSGDLPDSSPSSSKSTNSDKVEPMVTGPVLSLKCLHEDSDEEPSFSKSDDESPSKFIDVNDVPELSLKGLEKDEPEHPNLEPINKKVPPSRTLICIPVRLARQNIPDRSSWDGIHNFKVKVDCSTKPNKSESPVYSESRNKLYVCKYNPFKVLVSAVNVPTGSMIRVHAVYSRSEDSNDAVRRCPTHAQEDFAKGSITFEHFVQCVSDSAIYEKNTNTGRLSVLVPYTKPQDGETYTTYLLKLTCFNSCTGGINRRPFTLVFTLERNNTPLGRQIMEAKVCACPARDFKLDEEKEERKLKGEEEKTGLHSEEKSRSVDDHEPSQSSGDGKQKYTITVKDRELYEFLKHMKDLYQIGVYKSTSDA